SNCTSQKQAQEKLVPRMLDSSMRNRKRLRKRQVTAFDYNRRLQSMANQSAEAKIKTPSKEPPKQESDSVEKFTARSTIESPSKSKS
ncbi:hypothetical protein KR044_005065, partial [Drosophila immigrans]